MGEEKMIENTIKKWLTKNQHWHLKVQGGANNPSAGVPDIIACINGVFVGIEVKTKTGSTTKIQEYQIDMINKSGGFALVVTTLEELIQALSERKNI